MAWCLSLPHLHLLPCFSFQMPAGDPQTLEHHTYTTHTQALILINRVVRCDLQRCASNPAPKGHLLSGSTSCTWQQRDAVRYRDRHSLGMLPHTVGLSLKAGTSPANHSHHTVNQDVFRCLKSTGTIHSVDRYLPPKCAQTRQTRQVVRDHPAQHRRRPCEFRASV